MAAGGEEAVTLRQLKRMQDEQPSAPDPVTYYIYVKRRSELHRGQQFLQRRSYVSYEDRGRRWHQLLIFFKKGAHV